MTNKICDTDELLVLDLSYNQDGETAHYFLHDGQFLTYGTPEPVESRIQLLQLSEAELNFFLLIGGQSVQLTDIFVILSVQRRLRG